MSKLIFTALLASLAAAHTAVAGNIEMNFTGYVNSSNDAAVPVGTALTGQLMLCYCGLNSGVVGSTSGWEVDNTGDIDIYSVSISTGSYQYFTGEVNPPQVQDYEILGKIVGSANGIYAVADLIVNYFGPLEFVDSFEISNPAGSPPPYTPDGIPVFTSTSSAGGSFTDPYGNSIGYTVTSLTLATGPPHVYPVVTGTQGLSGWYISATTLTWNVLSNPTPTTSGCGAHSVPNTKGKTYRCSATNSLGSATDSITLNVDTVRPDVTITTPLKGGTYALNSTVYASYVCSDKTSGVALCLGTVADGALITTSSKGTNHFTVTSTDNAGNTEIKTISYKVE